MNKYILGITREALKSGDVSIDDFVERIEGVEGLIAPDSFSKRVLVEYPGSRDELYGALGYTPNQVHIEKPNERHPLR